MLVWKRENRGLCRGWCRVTHPTVSGDKLWNLPMRELLPSARLLLGRGSGLQWKQEAFRYRDTPPRLHCHRDGPSRVKTNRALEPDTCDDCRNISLCLRIEVITAADGRRSHIHDHLLLQSDLFKHTCSWLLSSVHINSKSIKQTQELQYENDLSTDDTSAHSHETNKRVFKKS